MITDLAEYIKYIKSLREEVKEYRKALEEISNPYTWPGELINIASQVLKKHTPKDKEGEA